MALREIEALTAGIATDAPFSNTNNVAAKSSKETSQYWANLGFIADIEKLKAKDPSGVAYCFEMGFPIDNIDEKFEKTGRSDTFNMLINLKNDLRSDIREAKEGLNPGDWTVIALTDDPKNGDVCLHVHRNGPTSGMDVDELCKNRAKKRTRF